MDQFYISYRFDAPLSLQTTTSKPIIQPSDFQILQSQANEIQLSTLVKSYISSLLIALRLDARIQSTSISSRAVNDIRNFVQVMSLTGETGSNVRFVPDALERCVGFRLRLETGQRQGVESVLRE